MSRRVRQTTSLCLDRTSTEPGTGLRPGCGLSLSAVQPGLAPLIFPREHEPDVDSLDYLATLTDREFFSLYACPSCYAVPCSSVPERGIVERGDSASSRYHPGVPREDCTRGDPDAGRQADAKPLPLPAPTCLLHLICVQLIIHSMHCGSRPANTYRTDTAPSATCPRIERMSSALRRGLPTDPG